MSCRIFVRSSVLRSHGTLLPCPSKLCWVRSGLGNLLPTLNVTTPPALSVRFVLSSVFGLHFLPFPLLHNTSRGRSKVLDVLSHSSLDSTYFGCYDLGPLLKHGKLLDSEIVHSLSFNNVPKLKIKPVSLPNHLQSKLFLFCNDPWDSFSNDIVSFLPTICQPNLFTTIYTSSPPPQLFINSFY